MELALLWNEADLLAEKGNRMDYKQGKPNLLAPLALLMQIVHIAAVSLDNTSAMAPLNSLTVDVVVSSPHVSSLVVGNGTTMSQWSPTASYSRPMDRITLIYVYRTRATSTGP